MQGMIEGAVKMALAQAGLEPEDVTRFMREGYERMRAASAQLDRMEMKLTEIEERLNQLENKSVETKFEVIEDKQAHG